MNTAKTHGGHRGAGLAQTQAARDARRYDGLERYPITLYLEPEQVQWLRGLESKQRSSVIRSALTAFSAEQHLNNL